MPAPFLRHAVIALAFFAPAPAFAQKPPPATDSSKAPEGRQTAARGLALEGLKLFGADRYAEALATFREADALFHAPSVTLYIARCQRKMGKLLDARATYDKLLAEDLPKDASPQFVQAHVEAGQELEALKHRIPTLRVVVVGVPAGEAQVMLDGVPFVEGTKELDPGRYTVEIRRATRPGEAPVTRAVLLVEGSPKILTVDLGAATVPEGTPPGRWYLPGGIALGVGVLGLGAGVVSGALSLAKVSQIKSQCIGTSCPPSLKGEGDSAKLLGYVSTTTFAVGGAGAIAGGVLLYVFRPRQPPAQGRAGWGVSMGVGRVDVEGRF
jgi:hypothetical protein